MIVIYILLISRDNSFNFKPKLLYFAKEVDFIHH